MGKFKDLMAFAVHQEQEGKDNPDGLVCFTTYRDVFFMQTRLLLCQNTENVRIK